MTLRLRRMKDWRPLEGHTADRWLREHAGKGSYDVFWGPMLRGKFGEDYFDQVGMAWVWGKIHTRFASRDKSFGREKLVYPSGSFGEVFDVLGERIEERGGVIRLCAEVVRVIAENGEAAALESKAQNGGTATERFDAVVSTTQSHIFSRLVPGLPEEYRSRLDSTRYMAAVLLILELDRPLSHIYWLNVADRSVPFVGVIEQTNLIEPSHYGGKHIVYLSNYLTREHRLYRLEHQELLNEYLPHLKKINPAFERSWVLDSHHHRVDAAQPIIGTRYSEQMPDVRTPIRRLYLSNTTQIYPEDRGTNFSVEMGLRVARMLMTDLEPGHTPVHGHETN
jgi:protoporphyrinogen oxidase